MKNYFEGNSFLVQCIVGAGILTASVAGLSAQTCGFDFLLKKSLSDTILFREYRQSDAAYYSFFKKKPSVSYSEKGQVVTIPVVVHILHHGGAENIPDAQVQTAIQYLNDAFSNAGYYDQGSGAAVNIRFCLAIRNPQGAFSTGINRVSTTLTNLTYNNDGLAKKLSQWPSRDYLNIWVVRDICWESFGCSVAAYASAPFFHGAATDGIMIEAGYVGTTPGKTTILVHEVGHYLGLLHTFEGGCDNSDCLIDGDRVCDTPPDQSIAPLPCDQIVNTCHTDTQSGLMADLPDATENFLDYGNTDCQHNFTQGQAALMLFFLNHDRKTLLTSLGCQLPCNAPVTAAFLPKDTSLLPGSTVVFDNKSLNASSYQWKIGDSLFSTAKNPAFKFEREGIFRISLTTFGDSPNTCPGQTITTTVQVTCPLRADFRLIPEQPEINQTVTIINSSQNADTQEWFINDIAQGPDLSTWKIDHYGTFEIRLVVTNGTCQREKTVTIAIEDVCGGAAFEKIVNTPASDEWARVSVALPDGSLLLGGDGMAGNSGRDIILIKSTPGGVILWTKRLAGVGNERLNDLRPLPDNGFIAAGDMSDSADNTQGFLAGFDKNGNLIWQKMIQAPGTGSSWKKIVADPDGKHYIACGSAFSANIGRESLFFIKIDPHGELIWSSCIGANVGIKATNIARSKFGEWFGTGIAIEPDGTGTDGLIFSINANGKQSNHLRSVTVKKGTADEALYGLYETNTNTGFFNTLGEISNWTGNPSIKTGQHFGWLLNFLTNGTIYRHQEDLNIGFSSSIDGGGSNAPYTYSPVNGSTGVTAGYIRAGVNKMYHYPLNSVSSTERITETPNHLLLMAGSTATAPNADRKMLWVASNSNGFTGECDQVYDSLASAFTEFVYTNLISIEVAPPPLITAPLTLYPYSAESISPCATENTCLITPCRTAWLKSFGTTTAQEGITVVKAGTDGKLRMAGFKNDSIVLLQMDAEGHSEWMRTIKNTSFSERITAVLVDSKGDWVCTGYAHNFANIHAAFIFKYDPVANIIRWSSGALTDTLSQIEYIEEIAPGGNYVLHKIATKKEPVSCIQEIDRQTGQPVSGLNLCYTNAGLFFTKIAWQGNAFWAIGQDGTSPVVARLNAAGQSLWVRRLNAAGSGAIPLTAAIDFAFADTGIVVVLKPAQEVLSKSLLHFVAAKIAPDGTLIWSKKCLIDGNPLQISAVSGDVFVVRKIESTAGGYMITGGYRAKGANSDYVILARLSPQGLIVWAAGIAAPVVNLDEAGPKMAILNADFWVGGDVSDNFGNTNFFLSRLPVSTDQTRPSCSSVWSLTSRTELLNLTFAPAFALTTAPYIGKTANLKANAQNSNTGPEQYFCTTACTEICDNGLDDDFDGAPDCFDADCACNPCRGESANFWQFGHRAGLDFSTEPPQDRTGGQSYAAGATACMSDPSGNLLFYISGDSVWNKRHRIVRNGTGLNSDKNAASCMAFPIQGIREYILVTQQASDVFYHQLDVTKQNFEGEISEQYKNKALNGGQPVLKFTAVACAKAVWVVMQLHSGNHWLARRFINQQPEPAVASMAGSLVGQPVFGPAAGQIKSSADGRLLASIIATPADTATKGSGGFDLLNFDPETGQITLANTIVLPELYQASGLEFSPDDHYLYVTTAATASHLWQFDLWAGDAEAIADSRTLIALAPPLTRYSFLQLARNQKIYVATGGPAPAKTLGVIERPNRYGNDCAFQPAGQPLGAGIVFYGLPNFVRQSLRQKPLAALSGPDTLCGVPATAQIRLHGATCADQIAWRFLPEGAAVTTFSNARNLTWQTQTPGEYQVIAEIFGNCGLSSDTLLLRVLSGQTPVLSLGPDQQTCAGGVVTLRATPGFSRYRWSDGTHLPTLTTFAAGQYGIEAWDACGNRQTDTIQVSVNPTLALLLGPDRCFSGGSTLFKRPEGFVSWKWTPSIYTSCDTCAEIWVLPEKITEYIVTAKTNTDCIATDTIRLTYSTGVTANIDTFVCQNTRLPFLNTSLPPDTTAIFVLKTANGCDSMLRVATFGLDTFRRAATLRVCPGQVLKIGDQTLSIGEVRTIRLRGSNGCDSVVTVTVAAFPAIELPLFRDTTLKIGDTLSLHTNISGAVPLRFAWQPAQHLSCSNCPVPLFTALENSTYTVLTTDANGCTASWRYQINVTDTCLVWWPNVFTPDGDGVNDYFYLMTYPCVHRIVSLHVYNRWGDTVFARTDFAPNTPNEGWNGLDTSGKPVPTDVLIWTAEVAYYDGSRGVYNGQVTVLR